MATGKWIACAFTVVLSSSLLFAAEDAKPDSVPATQPIEGHVGRGKKLVEPWKFITDLTPEQTDQILKIHADRLVQEKKIRDKETDDIMALLTPAQVTELKIAEAKVREANMEKSRERKEKKPTTAPAQ